MIGRPSFLVMSMPSGDFTTCPAMSTYSMPADATAGSATVDRSITRSGSKIVMSASAPRWSRPFLPHRRRLGLEPAGRQDRHLRQRLVPGDEALVPGVQPRVRAKQPVARGWLLPSVRMASLPIITQGAWMQGRRRPRGWRTPP